MNISEKAESKDLLHISLALTCTCSTPQHIAADIWVYFPCIIHKLLHFSSTHHCYDIKPVNLEPQQTTAFSKPLGDQSKRPTETQRPIKAQRLQTEVILTNWICLDEWWENGQLNSAELNTGNRKWSLLYVIFRRFQMKGFKIKVKFCKWRVKHVTFKAICIFFLEKECLCGTFKMQRVFLSILKHQHRLNQWRELRGGTICWFNQWKMGGEMFGKPVRKAFCNSVWWHYLCRHYKLQLWANIYVG